MTEACRNRRSSCFWAGWLCGCSRCSPYLLRHHNLNHHQVQFQSPQESLSKHFTSDSLRATLGTIDARWMAIVVLGGLRGPGTYGENFSEIFFFNKSCGLSVLCLAYAISPAVRGVENFNVDLFRTAISIVILITLLLQGVLTQVCVEVDDPNLSAAF